MLGQAARPAHPPHGAKILLVAAGFVAAACRGHANVPRDLVLVTIDTLRADRLGVYGSKDVATPVLDRIATEGVMAPETMVHVGLTRSSHVSLLTGLLPYQHGIRDNQSPGLNSGCRRMTARSPGWTS